MEKSYSHKEIEKNWYKIWVENDLFKADNKSKTTPFSMVLPPPNITGSLHMGHALTFTIPDIINRRKMMQDFNTLWLPGVDHAGIATQMVVEKHLKKEKGLAKEDLGREKFIQFVWNWKKKSEKQIIKQIDKLGLSLDWTRMKFTLDDDMKKTVIRVFVQLYKEGKIYQGTYMVNRCPSCKTVLSDLEVDHREIHGKLTYIKYPLKGKKDDFVVVATTRPETMLGDTAVAVNPEDERYKNIIGQELILPLTNRVIKIIADKRVDKEFGTGAVKITPAHDPNDYDIALKHNLKSVRVIDHNARMTGPIKKKFIGLDRFECREKIINDLKKLGLIEKEEDYVHNVGHCHRCETMVEPDISKQWFLKTSEIAKPAIEVVEKNNVVFIPNKWEKVFFNWMYNIKDWCISRQLWWGHRIPAYYCLECGQIMVEEERPPKCSNCNSTEIFQDVDVLDTWFSSALWPFSTLGWNVNSGDFKTYYPTSIMATGFDIIFFWVARMIMMGVHFTGEVPFREVLINGLIRDEKGQKMSKTKNNAVDPLDVIDKFGSDALRFTLAIQAVPGMDISFSMNRIKGYKAFANKIWNASRYVIMNLKGDENFNVDFKKISDTDKWILNFLNNIIEKVNDLMDNYRINEAADQIYHFFWHEYCDWYLEFAKNDIDNIDTRKVLKFTLFRLLQLLHPFMPFITEEIYQKIKINEDFLIQTKFPSFNSEMFFIDEYKDIELLKKIIMETRKTRTENRIDPNKKIDIYLKSESEKEREIVSNLLRYFNFLTKSISTEIKNDFSNLPKGFRGVCLNWEILLPFSNNSDRVKELKRLKKEVDKAENQIKKLGEKLSNKEFVTKAPELIVIDFKKNLQVLIDKREKIQKTISDLS